MKNLLFIFSVVLLSSCIKETDPVITGLERPWLTGNGVFILNEGNFRSGNGSISFFSYDSMKIYNNIFREANERPLGDVPYSMGFTGNRAYILVNNSDKIEIAGINTMKSVSTIEKVVSPRYISFVSGQKAYVTSLYSDSLRIINLQTKKATGYVPVKNTSEYIVTASSKAFVANWSGGNKIFVIDIASDEVTDSIEVGVEPESMVVDMNNTLWVLCNGGWKREHYAELIAINTLTNTISKRFMFPLITDSPTCLKIDGTGQFLYYLHDGVKRMDINAGSLPTAAFISQGGYFFYRMGVNPSNGEVFVTDALDYIQVGIVLRYSPDGVLLSSLEADIIPGNLFFKSDID
jgi:YVTN family beta-propeller protein